MKSFEKMSTNINESESDEEVFFHSGSNFENDAHALLPV